MGNFKMYYNLFNKKIIENNYIHFLGQGNSLVATKL